MPRAGGVDRPFPPVTEPRRDSNAPQHHLVAPVQPLLVVRLRPVSRTSPTDVAPPAGRVNGATRRASASAARDVGVRERDNFGLRALARPRLAADLCRRGAVRSTRSAPASRARMAVASGEPSQATNQLEPVAGSGAPGGWHRSAITCARRRRRRSRHAPAAVRGRGRWGWRGRRPTSPPAAADTDQRVQQPGRRRPRHDGESGHGGERLCQRASSP